jgi:glycosyltransferase involved in cell wall biosynthesis
MKKCLLSVAMIVKDEEHNIRRALESIKDIADEIVVVDTGSTDKTPEIVKEYTDKLYFHPWEGDFSKARNQSLKYPTCEWVLIFDADEEVKEDFKEIRNFLENLPSDVNAVYLPTLSYLDWDLKKTEVASTPRLFRNGTVYYKNIVHNQPVYKGKVVNAPFTLYHYGYIWTRKLRIQKYNRTRNLILKHLENKDLNPVERIYYLVQLYKTENISKYKNRKIEVGWKTLKEIEKIGQIPAIGLEFLFLFGMDALNKENLELAENLFNKAIEAVPKYPDPYYGLTGVYEKKDDLESQYKYAKLFLEKIEYAEKHPEEFEWTIVGFKFKGSANAVITSYYLKNKDKKNFEINIKKTVEFAKTTGENIKRLINIILQELLKINDIDFLKSIKSSYEYILNVLVENNINIDIWKTAFKFLDNNIKIDVNLLEKFVQTDFQNFVIKSQKHGGDFLLEFIFKNDFENNIKTLNEVLFLFKYFNGPKEKLLKLLASIRKNFSDDIQGIIYSLIGDIYLKLSNFSAAISSYKKAIELNKDISNFIKPVLDDLKTRLDPNIDGVFEEILNYYTKHKELILTIDANEIELKYLNLISNTDYAKYVASINCNDIDRKLGLLREIENKDEFPFYYYRLAKIYEEKEDFEKAVSTHIKACEENHKIADLKLGMYEYDGFYPNSTYTFMKNSDKIVWCRNISEKLSGFGIIHPIRTWKKTENFYYAYPYPTDDAIKIAKKRRKKLIKDWPFKISDEIIFNSLAELNENSIYIIENEEVPEYLLKELEINNSKESIALFSINTIHVEHDFSKIIPSHIQKGVIIYFEPNFDDKDDIVFFNPEFRVIRSTSQIKKELTKLGFRIKKISAVKNLRILFFEKD